MTKVIVISGVNIDSLKDEIDLYTKGKYHSYPTMLKGSYSNKTGFSGGAGFGGASTMEGGDGYNRDKDGKIINNKIV